MRGHKNADSQAICGVPQERRTTSLNADTAARGSAAAGKSERYANVGRLWPSVAGPIFAVAAILTLILTNAKRVVLRKAASNRNESQLDPT